MKSEARDAKSGAGYVGNRRRRCFEIQVSETPVVGLGIIGMPMALTQTFI